MEHSLDTGRNKFSLIGVLLLSIGFGSMAFAASFDIVRGGHLRFGIFHLAGLVIGGLIVLTGLRRMKLLRSKIWDALILLTYLAGIFYLGLSTRPHGFFEPHGYFTPFKPKGILRDLTFSFHDVVENLLGFLPLGYLMMLYLISVMKRQRVLFAAVVTVLICLGISFFIEYEQYYIPGRTSSLVDLFFNGLGAFCGTFCCFIEVKFFREERRGIKVTKVS